MVDHPGLEELRKRTPSGENDDRIIIEWLDAEIKKLSSGPAGTFRAALRKVDQDADTTRAFKETLAQRLGEFAKSRLTGSEDLSVAAAGELMWSLMDVNDPKVHPGLAAGLTHSIPAVRYAAAKGLSQLRGSLASAANPAVYQETIAQLIKAGQNETDGVVLERIYGALSTKDVDPVMLNAIAEVLSARVAKYRAGAALNDEAEISLVTYLSGLTLNRTQAVPIVQQLAVLVRLDVESRVSGSLSADHQDVIERRLCLCEEFLNAVVAGGGKICDALRAGQAGLHANMQLELINWVGSEDVAGSLNASPWSVPVGAP